MDRREKHPLRTAGLFVVALWILTGCTAVPASWTGGPTIEPTSPDPHPSPSAVPSPSPEPRPSLRYPDVQSLGELTIAFESPVAVPITAPISCEWVSTDQVGWLTILEAPRIAGEAVSIELALGQDASPLSFYRDDAAAYAAWPSGATGTVMLVERSTRADSGTIRFEDLRPEAESAPPGPLPSPLEAWLRPLGDDPAYARISGTVHWACAPAPATVPTPGPTITEEPRPSLPDLPQVSLVAGGQRQTGVTGCGGGFSIGGSSGSDSCGPSFQAPGEDRIVRLEGSARLRFELPDGWTFATYRLGWVLRSEAERFRSLVPDSFAEHAASDDASGRVLELEAPPAGDWTVRLTWSATRGADEMLGWPDYFRVIVAED